MKRILALLPLLLVGGCVTGVAREPVPEPSMITPLSSSPTSATALDPGPLFVTDQRFATVSISDMTSVVLVGLHGVEFLLDGNCTYAESENGWRDTLIWPEGHVKFDPDTQRVWFLDVLTRQPVVFTVGQVVDLRVTPRSMDSGYRPFQPEEFVVPPDPSCPDHYVALVTGVTVR